MFDFQITSGDIREDISDLSVLDMGDPRVNVLVQSLVLKFVQKYFNGNDISQALEKMVEVLENGGGWSMLGSPVQEAFAVECLADISTTAAIVKEILFNDSFQADESFRSCDLGSGTGILTLAAYIAGLRKGCTQGNLNLIDHEKTSLAKSGDVLKAIVEPSFEVNSILGDITDPVTLQELGAEKIHFWISETIGKQTPDFKVLSNGKVIIHGDQWMYEQSKALDPFPGVVGNIISQRSEVRGDVKKGKTAFFPDIINGSYKPKGELSTIKLSTGDNPQKRGLSEIGRDFGNISFLNERKRW